MYRFIDQDGWIDMATWLIILGSDSATFDEALSPTEGLSPNTECCSDALLAVRHETVHFWHAISTDFLYSYSVKYLRRCKQVLNEVRKHNKGYTDIPFSEFEPLMRELGAVLSCKYGGIRTIDIIEGSAVLCSYRMHDLDASHDSFLEHLKRRHSNQSQYSKAYLYATDLVGEHAFDVFSPACYLAMQGDHPAQNFTTIVKRAREKLSSMNSYENPFMYLLDTSGLMLNGCFPSVVRVSGIEEGFKHPILEPFAVRVSKQISPPAEYFFAEPYRYESRGRIECSSPLRQMIKDVVPPLHLYADRQMKLMGKGQALGTEFAQTLHHLTALVGLIRRLVTGSSPIMHCPHRDCYIHKRKLCCRYFAFPADDYSKCSFPDILKGMKLGRLLD